jgi:hypothetical protein
MSRDYLDVVDLVFQGAFDATLVMIETRGIPDNTLCLEDHRIPLQPAASCDLGFENFVLAYLISSIGSNFFNLSELQPTTYIPQAFLGSAACCAANKYEHSFLCPVKMNLL